MGLIANDPRHLGGAVAATGPTRARRAFQLCDAFGLPVLVSDRHPRLVMVGPTARRRPAVRKTLAAVHQRAAAAGHADVRGGCCEGLWLWGAQAMAGGSTLAPAFCAAWPTGEFGGMGLEGSVRLGYRRELEAETDPAARQALFDKLLGSLYARGKAIKRRRHPGDRRRHRPGRTRDAGWSRA